MIIRRITITSGIMLVLLLLVLLVAISLGSTPGGWRAMLDYWRQLGTSDPVLETIVWQVRLPRALMAALVGAALSLGGLAFQALLRNPLAEPYILGVSGGSAVGGIIGILMGFSRLPGVGLTAFAGSMGTLALVLVISSGKAILKKDALLLAGVMINAFCSAVIMFLVSITQDARLHNILFWLMGDLSVADTHAVVLLSVMLVPCFILFFWLSHAMNLLLMGKELAQSSGVNIRLVVFALLITTSFMVSATVAHCGLIAFVGLVMPHLLRLLLGPDHRVLVPACIMGGGAYLVLCDLLARTLPSQGEMPTGVVTALIGAPLFIILLVRSNK